MRILVDVNVIVDILGNTDDFADSFCALDAILLREFEPCLLASMTPTIHYVLAARKYATRAQATQALEALSSLVSVLDVTGADFRAALKSPLVDFEDALIAEAARRHGVDLILTRNLRDFRKSPVAAMSPRQFLEAYRPAGYEYGEVELDGEGADQP
ncbi:PIN domain-containing protein [Adlercreutzia faecimuris]|uniref:Ribonuclease VapC n=1 Tax=Adlercreutzia faecimuris TaxID=2897341 RepID=A0ABS9WJ55_9ACTN|nr:PIN domain-containing protein [Adlercreutzia sp. JBNU-10]MCI2242905.1 PIN domain-containing protein [Adlercreutzia sp. JBNU-10]